MTLIFKKRRVSHHFLVALGFIFGDKKDFIVNDD